MLTPHEQIITYFQTTSCVVCNNILLQLIIYKKNGGGIIEWTFIKPNHYTLGNIPLGHNIYMYMHIVESNNIHGISKFRG